MKKQILSLLSATLVFAACEKSVSTENENKKPDVFRELLKSDRSANPGGTLLADCAMYGVVGTSATFKPSAGNFDELYVNPAGFKYGIGAISESKPGDTDYNGGRWHVNMLKAGVDGSKYAETCSVEDLDLNDFISTDVYFACPLQPRK